MFFNCLVGRCRHLWKAIGVCVLVLFVFVACMFWFGRVCVLWIVFVFCLCMYFVTFVVVPSVFLQDVRLKFFSFPLNSCWIYLPCVKLIVHPWHSWTMMQGLLTRLFKLSKVTPSLTLLIFFKSTRFLHTRRPRWTFYCVRWCRCMLFIWFSKIDILKMEHAFQMGCREGDKVFYLFLTTWRGEVDTIDKHEKEWNVH